ncbi:MAG: ChaN family lipoprotein [Flavobacteriaceae bacterium]|nr:ChaN family lipoprotein [Flavobacteriaceae bacterium]
MKNSFLSILLLFAIVIKAQEKKAYQLFDKNGKKVSYKKLLKSAESTQVVLFGEFHNNAISHWLELELTKDIAQNKAIVQGAEMLEADNQKQLNQYLNGEINQKKLDSTARLWPNYKTDYKPLIDFALENKNPFVATNIPRRFASMVSKKGFEALETLTVEEKSWIAPQPIPYDASLPGYVEMMKMMGEHTSPNMPKAQASKDATMAYFIYKNLKENSIFIHYNGSYHSDNFEGISWYLKVYNPEIKIITISTVEQKDISKLEQENYNKADFILVIDEDVTKTY